MLGGRYTLRVAIGNLRTTHDHIATLWELLRECAGGLGPEGAR